MTEKMLVHFTQSEGAVVRMLGLVERRGFRVCGVNMVEQPCGRAASLALDLVARDESRRTDLLALQLRRLYEVDDVVLENDCAREKAA